jgi:histidinol-phosphate aminotransferase
MQLDQRKMVSAIRKLMPKVIFLSTPNNPTGTVFQRDAIEEIIRITNGIVVVDEAYQPFSREKSFVADIKRFPRLAVLRTFSKIGLAALRMGYLVADEGLIAEVNKVRLPYNVNSLTQALTISALRRKKEILAIIKNVMTERDRLVKELSTIQDIEVIPSEANFVLIRIPNADTVHAKLIAAGILVRNIGTAFPNALRVTIGTPQENAAFLAALKKILKENR